MEVCIGYECHWDYANLMEYVEKVFLDEKDAKEWVSEFENTEFIYRKYRKHQVE